MDDKVSKLCISPHLTALEAVKVLDETHERIVLIVENGILLGVLTDADVRKWILRNGDMSKKVTELMTSRPICVREGETDKAAQLMEKHGIDAIPVIGMGGELIDLIFRYVTKEEKRHTLPPIDVPVVIMAGGMGTRLRPYTQVLPKPLLPVGNATILEQVIESFREAGCRRFYLSVNYRKNLVKAYLKDTHPEYAIDYVEEEDYLGTAGSLYLVRDKINEVFFVSNCDILLDIDYRKVLSYHIEQGDAITLVTSLKNYRIPYGVVNLGEAGNVESLSEKPELSFLVNTGVYVLDPSVLEYISPNAPMHITDLILICLKNGEKIGTFPITEKAWEDIGEPAAMEKALRARDYE